MSPRWAADYPDGPPPRFADWQPFPYADEKPPKCRCSHTRSQHGRGEGQCYLGACGCATYRPKETA